MRQEHGEAQTPLILVKWSGVTLAVISTCSGGISERYHRIDALEELGVACLLPRDSSVQEGQLEAILSRPFTSQQAITKSALFGGSLALILARKKDLA